MITKDEQWVVTGVGGPLPTHADFERVGAQCPAGFGMCCLEAIADVLSHACLFLVVTGVSFVRGGWKAGVHSWTEKIANFAEGTAYLV
jgi:hypothetical protein